MPSITDQVQRWIMRTTILGEPLPESVSYFIGVMSFNLPTSRETNTIVLFILSKGIGLACPQSHRGEKSHSDPWACLLNCLTSLPLWIYGRKKIFPLVFMDISWFKWTVIWNCMRLYLALGFIIFIHLLYMLYTFSQLCQKIVFSCLKLLLRKSKLVVETHLEKSLITKNFENKKDC